MSEELNARINLPLTPSVYAAIKKRAAEERMSAVGFIRKCIDDGLKNVSRLEDLDKRLVMVEEILRRPVEKKKIR